MCRLIKIDELLIRRHKYLEKEDECYYLMDYPPYYKYGRTPNTCLIMDFKIGLERKGKFDWKKKGKAINDISINFQNAVSPVFRDSSIIMIPVPPSKTKQNVLYDDRMIQLINNYRIGKPQVELKEVISIINDLPTSHLSEDRETPEELLNHLVLDVNFSLDNKQVVLVDDVITHGAHFKACQELILSKFNPTNIIGIFIGSTII